MKKLFTNDVIIAPVGKQVSHWTVYQQIPNIRGPNQGQENLVRQHIL